MYIQPDVGQIAPLNVYKQQSERIQQNAQEPEHTHQSAKPERQGDRVNLSGAARMMAEARRAAQEAPDIRQERVAQLKDQVENGTYTVDNRSIAEAVLREDMDLFR